MANDVVLIAGLKTEMLLADGVTWQRVPKLTTIGAVGEQADAKEKTTLEDQRKKYGAGILDSDDRNIEGYYIPAQESGDEYYEDYVLQQAFIKRARALEEFNMRITYKDGDMCGFLYKCLGFEFQDPNQEDWKTFTVDGKQNSVTIFGMTVTGDATVAAAATITLTATPDAIADDLDDDDITWSSSDEAVATVDSSGVVTGVAAGTVTITASARGVEGSLEITVTA